MAASLPGATHDENAANPTQGRAVIFDPLSGPKRSPFGGATLSWDANNHVVKTPDPTNLSSGALATGIGFGSPPVFGVPSPQSIINGGFTDDYTVGVTTPGGTASADARHVYIGGGRSDASAGKEGIAATNPYTAGYAICMAGNGASRDGGAGPVFTGFPIKTVTAPTDNIANGSTVETGWVNRSGQTLRTNQSVFGSGGTPNAAPTAVAVVEDEPA